MGILYSHGAIYDVEMKIDDTIKVTFRDGYICLFELIREPRGAPIELPTTNAVGAVGLRIAAPTGTPTYSQYPPAEPDEPIANYANFIAPIEHQFPQPFTYSPPSASPTLPLRISSALSAATAALPQHPKYIKMSPLEDQSTKWRNGQTKHGVEFKDHPLEELYEEILDALNYTDEAQRQRKITPSDQQLLTAMLTGIKLFVRGKYYEGNNS